MPLTADEQKLADTLKAARDYVWKSFDLHFKQRSEFLRNYSSISVAIYAGYGFVLKDQQYLFGVFVASFAIVLTLAFYRIDGSARRFMWDYKAFLAEDERLMATILRDENPQLAEHVKLFEKSGQRTSGGYASIIYAFYWANGLLAAAIMIVSLLKLCGGR
jgi:hypothetical protein